MFGLDAAVRPWKLIPRSSAHWSSANHEVLWSVAINLQKVVTSFSLYFCMYFNYLVAVISKRFHILLKQLTVDCGIFWREELSWQDFVAQVASHHSSTLESTELLWVTHSFTPKCLILFTGGHGRDCVYIIFYIFLLYDSSVILLLRGVCMLYVV